MTLNAQQENEKTIVKTHKTQERKQKQTRRRKGRNTTLTRTVLSSYIDGVHQSSLRMCRDQQQQQQFPSTSPSLISKNGWKMHLENCCFHSLCLCWGRLFVLFGFRLLGTVLISVISSFRVDCFHSCCRISGHAD